MEVRRRLEALRTRMREKGLDAYLVPSTDPHQSEYVPECWQRRAWISGFTGSAGDVVVTLDRAGLWTDGRYWLQAEAELGGSGIDLYRVGTKGVPSVEEFLAEGLGGGGTLGCDPRVLSVARARSLDRAVEQRGGRLKLLRKNLVDAAWDDQPPLPVEPLRVQPRHFAGETAQSKLRRLRRSMASAECEAHVLSSLDAIMWLLNLRGRDVDFNPVAICYLIVRREGATLFVDQDKVGARVAKSLSRLAELRPYVEFERGLRDLAREKAMVWVDEGTASRWILDLLRGARLHAETSPVVSMKARKNPTEIEGMRAAHERDGVAMVRFLSWLEEAVPVGGVTEISAADRLEEFRAEGEHFQGLSFRTISGYAAHGAIIHYSVDETTDVPLKAKGIYLVDSGAQYLDGTTDITRTVLLGGRATREQKERFTRVLMGHVDLAQARFPAGVRGLRLDTLARMPLWQAGLDYQHGTGHGVGAHLNVHEGPQSIGPRCTGAALEPGNVMSNEPGYYEAGAYGIRTENLVLVVEAPELSSAGAPWYRFETLTLCPIDTRLVDLRLLGEERRGWLNQYHRTVRQRLSPHLDAPHRRWLAERCRVV